MPRFLLFILTLASGGLARAQPSAERPFKIIKLDPALDDIISPDAKLETLGDHFGLTEGPVWVQHGDDGYLVVQRQRGQRDLQMVPARAAFGLSAKRADIRGTT